MGLRKKFGVILLIILLSFPSARVSAATVSDISKQLICQCGCTMVLLNCSHVECGSREEMTTVIAEKLAQGQSTEQILQLFVAQYGEQVLASPPKRGFNLTAWIAPFAAIILGGGVIYAALRTWVGRSRSSVVSTTVESKQENGEYRRRLEKELEEYDGRGFR